MRAWLALTALSALASGAAFRAAAMTGIAGLRMAATILLAIGGWGLAAAAEAYQTRRAIGWLESRLAEVAGTAAAVLQLPGSWGRRYRWARGYLLVGEGGILVAAALGLSHFTRRPAAIRQLDGCAASLKEAVRRIKETAAPAGPSGPAAGAGAGAGRGSPPPVSAVPGYGLVILLRRRVNPVERQRMRLLGVGLANPEHVPDVLRPVLAPPGAGLRRLTEAEQVAIARTLELRLGATPVAPRAADGDAGQLPQRARA
ncbi:MAG: hypothetical protein AB1609_00070 [Bacillota bacterium]